MILVAHDRDVLGQAAEFLVVRAVDSRAAHDHAAAPVEEADARFAPAPADGVFPEQFYATTNLETHVLIEGVWAMVRYPEMDCGVVLRPPGPECLPMSEVRAGESVLLAGSG